MFCFEQVFLLNVDPDLLQASGAVSSPGKNVSACCRIQQKKMVSALAISAMKQ